MPSKTLQKAVEQGKKDTARILAKQDRAAAGANDMINLIVALTVGGLIAAFLLPVAIDEIVGVDTSNWSSGAQSVWDILDLIIVIGLLLFMIGLALARSKL